MQTFAVLATVAARCRCVKRSPLRLVGEEDGRNGHGKPHARVGRERFVGYYRLHAVEGRRTIVNPSRSATLTEVAKRAGVHVGTASRALSATQAGLVAPATVEKVRAAADALGYSPDLIARGLKTGRSGTIGILLPDLTNPIFPAIVRGIDDFVADHGHLALIANTDDDDDREANAFEALRARQVDGIIAASVRRGDPLVERARAMRVPLVLVMRTSTVPGVWSVVPDETEAMDAIVAHLVELGHERIAHVAGPQRIWNGAERHAGLRAGLRARDLDLPAGLVSEAEHFTLEAGRNACEALLASDQKFTAIVAGNDLIALGCLEALAAAGLRCPRDVSIVGVNDMPLADHFRPALTTVRLPQREMGRVAGELLLERIRSKATRGRHVRIPGELLVRDSTARARQ
jgi:LacI family transcriptional regulator